MYAFGIWWEDKDQPGTTDEEKSTIRFADDIETILADWAHWVDTIPQHPAEITLGDTDVFVSLVMSARANSANYQFIFRAPDDSVWWWQRLL